MIHRDRQIPAPADVTAALNKPLKGSGLTERAAAENYYNANPGAPAYDFARYREEDVCKALTAMFKGKCAYCESPYVAVDALDVEHFRPKGGVEESPGHPGYWWLAAEWTNLLPSCPPCNQRRRQVQYQPGMTLEDIERQLQSKPSTTSGKKNAFPVLNDNWVTMVDGDLGVEDPLLINPCERQPDDFLEWVFDRDPQRPVWEAALVVPFLRPRLVAGSDSRHGQHSIAIYGLNRVGVVRERIKQVRILQGVCPPIIDALTDLAEEDPATPKYQTLLGRLKRNKAALTVFEKPEHNYAGMASAFVKAFESDLAKFGP